MNDSGNNRNEAAQGTKKPAHSSASHLTNSHHVIGHSTLAGGNHQAPTLSRHYYTEGGWGWLVCLCAFVVNSTLLGFQLGYGSMLPNMKQHWKCHNSATLVWCGVLNQSLSYLLSSLILALCRRNSPRMIAFLAALLTLLATLFTSFSDQSHQLFISYGILYAIGASACQVTSGFVIGQYFKRLRPIAEAISMAGQGFGLVVMAAFQAYSFKSNGWRLSLQYLTLLMTSSLLVFPLYRPASLYHPQRRAILHLKQQRRKVTEKQNLKKMKSNSAEWRNSVLSWHVLQSRTVQTMIGSAFFNAAGFYSILILMGMRLLKFGYSEEDAGLFYVYLGAFMVLGTCLAALLMLIPHSFNSKQYQSQALLIAAGGISLAMHQTSDLRMIQRLGAVLGTVFGGYQYTIKLFVYEKVGAKNFAQIWAFVEAGSSVGVLSVVPLTYYLQFYEFGAEIYLNSVCFVLASLTLFLLNINRRWRKTQEQRQLATYMCCNDRCVTISNESALGELPRAPINNSNRFLKRQNCVTTSFITNMGIGRHKLDNSATNYASSTESLAKMELPLYKNGDLLSDIDPDELDNARFMYGSGSLHSRQEEVVRDQESRCCAGTDQMIEKHGNCLDCSKESGTAEFRSGALSKTFSSSLPDYMYC